MSALARVLGVSGAVVLVSAATVGVWFFGATSWLTLVPLVTSLLALGVAGVLQGPAWVREGNAWRSRMRSGVVVFAVAAIAVGLNVLAARSGVVLDVTRGHMNSLSEATVQVARALAGPVRVVAFLDDDRAFTELSLLVDQVRAHASGLTLTRRSLKADAEEAQHLGIDGSGPRVVVETEVAGVHRLRRLRFDAGAIDQEEVFTNALRALTVTTRQRIYVLAGHGEAELNDASVDGLREFGNALVDDAVDVVPLPLATVGAVPDDTRLVIVAGPKHALLPAEIAALQHFVDGGGRLLVLLDPESDGGLSSLLGGFGIQVNGDVVRDDSKFAGVLGGADTALGVAYAAHPITQHLGSSMTHFPHARSLSMNPGTGALVVELVQTGASAQALGAHAGSDGKLVVDGASLAGPLTLGVASERTVEERAGKSAKVARVVVLGSASFVRNHALSFGANRDLALDAVQWLRDDDDKIVVRPHARGGHLLFLTPTQRERLAFALLYALPTLLLCIGLSVWAVRSRR